VRNKTSTKGENKTARTGGNKKAAKPELQSRNRLLRSFTEDAMRSYFRNLDGHKPADLYKLVMGEVESPLLKAVMEYSDGNQTIAAEILGLNRATLRKKLRQHQLLN